VTVATLLAELRNRDIQVWVEDDQLRCNAPVGVLTPDLRDVLRQRKRDMIEFLRSAQALAQQQRGIVPLQQRGNRTPVFAMPGHNGDVFLYRALAQHLGDDQPFFGLEPPGLDGQSEPLASVEDLASYFAEQIRTFRPDGPYVIAGYCAGATIAFELARQIQQQGSVISSVIFFAGAYPTWYRFLPQMRERVALRTKRVGNHIRALFANAERLDYIKNEWQRRKANGLTSEDPVMTLRERLKRITAKAVSEYVPSEFTAPLCQILPSSDCVLPRDATQRWRNVARNIEEYCGPDGCEGDVMLLEPHVNAIANVFRRCRDRNTQ
jgi:thioesterase domain-containing protein